MQNGASKSNRHKLLLVLGLFAVPIVASFLAYYVWKPQGAVTNYGELITPVQPTGDITLSQLDGSPIAMKSLRGKWLLLYAGSGACDARCEKSLYAMRQVRLLQNREQDRVRRVWVVMDGVAPGDALLKGRFEGTLALRDPQRALLDKLPVKSVLADHIYIIDPLGNIMMRYEPDPDLKRMAKDLERLLRASWVG
jgi:cytochrome oxidase Cu insertion factor (SCO1/SenC/PrrC family)